MNKYLKKLPFNYFHYYAIAVLIVLLGLNNKMFFVLYIPFYYLIKNYKNKLSVIIVSLVLLFSCITYENINKRKPVKNTFIVVKKTFNNDYYTYYVKQGFNQYIFYNSEQLNIGDEIIVDYEYEEFTKNKRPNSFNFKNYYASKRVFYKLIVKDIKVAKNKFHLNKIKEKIFNKLNKYPENTAKYLKMFLFSHDDFDEQLNKAKISLGIVHLFALSGMHINFIIGTITFISKKLKININQELIFIVLIIYLWFSDFSVSLFRAVLMYFFSSIFEKRGMSKLDSLSLSFIVMLLINPFYMYRVGFILSYLISFILIITPYKNNIENRFVLHIKIFLAILLIVSNINGRVYPMSLFLGFLFTLIFPLVILPVIAISVFPFMHVFSEPILKGFNNLILTLETNIYFKMPYQNIFKIFLYLAVFTFTIYTFNNKEFFKRSFVLVVLIFVIYISPNFSFNKKLYFLDVDQGDATFIQNKFNKGNILIDANKGTKEFLETLGNINIEYFFITHGDLDHGAEAKEIIETFNVKNIIVSPYDDSDIINSIKDYNLIKAKPNDVYNINNIKVEVLGPLRNYNNLNNNSLVLKLKIFNETYLFTGDIEQEAIADLIDKYSYNLKSDVLHVSHHGAYGGTPKEFLEHVRPKEAIISVGKNNFYNHPHQTTISNLEYYNIKIYKTSKQQTIIKRKYDFSF